MAETEFDVVVIGGGIAGMVAANRAAELGKRVAVLEKSTEEQYICNSRITYGTFHINFTSPEAAEDDLVRKVEDVTEGTARNDIARAVAKEGRRLMQWLRGQGIELNDLGQYHTHVLSPVQRSGAGLKWNGYAGDVALKRLEANFKGRQGRMLRGTRVTGLKLATGGLAIETAGGEKFKARAVVIADGGFQANTEMVREHISPAPAKLLQRHGGTAMGDGYRMAKALGAATTSEMENFYGHLHSREAMTDARLWPRPQADDLAAAAIVIDAQGRRVADEGYGGIYLSNAIARLPDPLGTTIIFDQAIWDGPPGRGHVQPPNPLVPETGGTLHRADTLAALAPMIGLAPATLESVVAEYNKALDEGSLQKLKPPRSDRHKPWPIKNAPFYAMPICTAITNTMGGIIVDGGARMLDTAGEPIPGLYAAGSTVGGLDGGPHSGYFGGLIKATIGLIAAETLAR
ncbi:MAG: FAD-dependent oxidoreductase [Xanthobacteraceae bacterium]|nr:FAD-dependent oxidoreductase [Xanthobacteraceae bacterium]